MAISAKQVNELRQKTGAGIMDCKRALTEVDGDIDKAITFLREKGMATAGKKAARVAAEGKVEAYLHMGGKIGVIIEVNCETDFVARGDDFQGFCREMAMQVAAANPLYLTSDEVPKDMVEAEQEIFRKQAAESGKPEKVIEQMVVGKTKKWYSQICLMDQPYIREQKMSVEQMRKEIVTKTNENVVIRRFVRFELGEGIEKKTTDLAEEVKAQIEAAKA